MVLVEVDAEHTYAYNCLAVLMHARWGRTKWRSVSVSSLYMCAAFAVVRNCETERSNAPGKCKVMQ